jgi:hypothetical protein
LLKLLLFLFVISPAWATDQPFIVTLKMFKPITVTKNRDLIFPAKILSGGDESIVVGTGETGAADFSIFGGNNRSVVRTVLESSLTLTAPGVTGTVTVDNFTVSGPLAFNGSGQAEGLRVGATAKILASNENGDYAGIATFRVVYQ